MRAAAVILVAACSGAVKRAPAPAPMAAAAIDPMSAASMQRDVAWLCDDARAGRGSLSPESLATATWLEHELAAAHLDVTTQEVPDTHGQKNVIAIYPGKARGKALLLVAHYDHLGRDERGLIYRGADDNASGVAVLLAVARDLAAKRDVDRPVVFLFPAAEELGLLGSHAYADDPRVPLAQTRGVINLDMVGRHFFELAVDRDAAIGAVGLADDPAFGDAARKAAKDAGLDLIETSPPLLYAIGEAFRSDDWSLRAPSLPALHFSTGLHDDYHRATDTPDKLVPAQLERTARLVRGIVTQMDAETDRER
ncbi:MAG TPA: M20/M25/M40 family metallo-hydrolase [Kofleriaceae bacterium]|nr:M20/M25/M40 family metallo-hydrolase [Kofleriaceae bacterium]